MSVCVCVCVCVCARAYAHAGSLACNCSDWDLTWVSSLSYTTLCSSLLTHEISQRAGFMVSGPLWGSDLQVSCSLLNAVTRVCARLFRKSPKAFPLMKCISPAPCASPRVSLGLMRHAWMEALICVTLEVPHKCPELTMPPSLMVSFLAPLPPVLIAPASSRANLMSGYPHISGLGALCRPRIPWNRAFRLATMCPVKLLWVLMGVPSL